MEKFEIFDAKKKLSQLVERATRGEQIGITHHGKLVALIVPAHPKAAAQRIFDGIEQIRKHARKTRKLDLKSLVEGGRE
jgi:prevent-host-death family protein